LPQPQAPHEPQAARAGAGGGLTGVRAAAGAALAALEARSARQALGAAPGGGGGDAAYVGAVAVQGVLAVGLLQAAGTECAGPGTRHSVWLGGGHGAGLIASGTEHWAVWTDSQPWLPCL